ncbi:MAG: glycosyltransferase [Chthoniobacteraceae bacterium]|nr:glycosyltransferase [Chthoniobacteraceae bacterium]
MNADADILFVAMENWDEVWRRDQCVAAEFARRAPGRKVLYEGLPIDVSHGLRTLSLRPLWRALRRLRTPASPQGLPNIHLFNPVKWLPTSLPFGQRFNRWLERRQLRRAAHRLGLRRPILWLNPHYALHLAGRMGESLVVYDITDDWTQIRQAAWLRRQTIAEDAELCRRANVVFVVSERLRQLKSPLCPGVRVIPNGVHIERYRAVTDGTLEAHSATAAWRHPVLAYTGTIHPERVDLPLVEAVANAFPEATVALVGPRFLDARTERRLRAHANILLPGPFPFEEMPRLMRAFDVCIVPHVLSAFTESLDPLKLYEYLASGLPIVSTPVPGFRDHPRWVRLGRTAPEFCAAIREALAEPHSARARRRAAASGHAWSARVDAIEATIQSTSSLCQDTPSSPSSSSATTPRPSR